MGAARAIACIESPEAASALLHPVRRQILELLEEPDSAAGIARRLRLPRQKVNYHLRELESAGHVELHSERKQGNCTERLVQRVAAHYLISPEALGMIGRTDPSEIRDQFSWAYLVATVGRALRELTTLRRRADSVKKQLPTFTLETEICFASPESLHAFSEQLSREVARLVSEHHDETNASGRVFRFFIGAHPAITKSEEEAEAEAKEQPS